MLRSFIHGRCDGGDEGDLSFWMKVFAVVYSLYSTFCMVFSLYDGYHSRADSPYLMIVMEL